MYNLAPKLKELARKLRSGKNNLIRIQAAAQNLTSLTTMTQGHNGLEPIVVEAEESDMADDLDDDFGVFGADDIQHILEEMNYKIDSVPSGHPPVAQVSNLTNSSETGFLKFVTEEQQNDIPILQYLSKIDSPRNHTISGVQFWPVHGGQVILMPSAGDWIMDLDDLDAHLWSVAGQLFEAVDFMHQHGVAHLGLKPGNIIISPDGGRLSIVGFHTSVRVKNVNTLFHGAVGTRRYIPPEAATGCGPFSAVRADLWFCGKVLEELCGFCRRSVECDYLLQIAQALMDEVPEKRPMMADVLKGIADMELAATKGRTSKIADPTVYPD
ncbi:kinase-like domain-containing protein [Infundibulicybe gibba]|nr:kinase-like domain-containing protein [Infundibulicybe gibba]